MPRLLAKLATLSVAAAIDPQVLLDTIAWPPAAPPLPSPSSPAWPPAGHVRHSAGAPPASRASDLSTITTPTEERIARTAWDTASEAPHTPAGNRSGNLSRAWWVPVGTEGSSQGAAGSTSSSKSDAPQPTRTSLPTLECNADDGILGCWETGCIHECTAEMLGTFSRFSIVCMASHTFGGMLSPFGFPGITLFLGFGVLAGPFGFGLIAREEELQLQWINDLALGFIGLSAGGKFLLSEIGPALKPALYVLVCLIGVTYVGTLSVTLLVGDRFIPFLGALEFGDKLAASLLIACLAVARSPSSAIAIISEMNAQGPFTTISLTVTILMDVVVVLLFAFTNLLAATLSSASTNPGSAAGPLMVLVSFLAQVVLSALVGLTIGHTLPLLLGFLPARRTLQTRGSLVMLACSALLIVLRLLMLLLQRVAMMLVGWGLFFEELVDAELRRWEWQNPLICCMIAGFVIVNWTRAGESFHDSVHDLSGPIYLFFFTYTGVCMDLGVLARNVPACALLFTTRTVCIFIGSWLGASLAQQPPEHRNLYWMAFLTQAGVTLGLAQSVSAHFEWGPDFAASIVAVVVCNQVVGPPLFKHVIRLVGEQHHNYDPLHAASNAGSNPLGLGNTSVEVTGRPQARGALVIAPDGAEQDFIVRRLRDLGWEVLGADPNMSVTPADSTERKLFDQRSGKKIAGLPRAVRAQIRSYNIGPKPWEQMIAHRSLPAMSLKRRPSRDAASMGSGYGGSGARSGTSADEARRSVRRTYSFDHGKKTTPSSLGQLMQPPAEPTLPEDAKDDPDRYAQCMRLLWLATSMKSFDVLVALLPTDEQNLAICDLVADMLPLLHSVHKHQRQPPQVLVTLSNEDVLRGHPLSPKPFVIPQNKAVPSLVCEVLHPTAHWSGSLDAIVPDAAPDAAPPPDDAAPADADADADAAPDEEQAATRPDELHSSGGSGKSVFGFGKRRVTHSAEDEAGGTWRLPWSRGGPPVAGASSGTPLL